MSYTFLHHHPSIYNIKRSIVNVYKINIGRSVGVRTQEYGLVQVLNCSPHWSVRIGPASWVGYGQEYGTTGYVPIFRFWL